MTIPKARAPRHGHTPSNIDHDTENAELTGLIADRDAYAISFSVVVSMSPRCRNYPASAAFSKLT
jgi:hypothetical protein